VTGRGRREEPPRWALWLLAAVPLLFAAISMPLMLGWVAPNSYYGVRTTATFASDLAWYRANHASGVAGVAGGLLGFAVNLAVLRAPITPQRKHALCLGVLVTVSAAIAAAGLLAG